MGIKKVDPLDKRSLDVVSRYMRVMRTIGITEKQRAIIVAFLLYDRPWSIQALAGFIGYTRTSTRKGVEDGVLAGHFKRTLGGGYVITPKGRNRLGRLLTEATQVAWRDQPYLSQDLLEELRSDQTSSMNSKWDFDRQSLL